MSFAYHFDVRWMCCRYAVIISYGRPVRLTSVPTCVLTGSRPTGILYASTATDPAGRLAAEKRVENDQVQYTYRTKRTTTGQGPGSRYPFLAVKIFVHAQSFLTSLTDNTG